MLWSTWPVRSQDTRKSLQENYKAYRIRCYINKQGLAHCIFHSKDKSIDAGKDFHYIK